MILVNISAVPNQTLTIQLSEQIYQISLRESNGVMSISVTRAGEVIVNNMRLTAGTPVLPYRYQESGNFLMTVENQELPYYNQFGVTQFLFYLSAEEIAALRAA